MNSIEVGAHVLIAGDVFAGWDGFVESIDRGSDKVTVRIDVFGKPVFLSLALSTIDQHLMRFGDQPIIQVSPNAERRKQYLLSECPGADMIFRTACSWPRHIGSVYIFCIGSLPHLAVRAINMTEPIRENNQGTSHALPLSEQHWSEFMSLIGQCGFWQLLHDDGRRIQDQQGESTGAWKVAIQFVIIKSYGKQRSTLAKSRGAVNS